VPSSSLRSLPGGLQTTRKPLKQRIEKPKGVEVSPAAGRGPGGSDAAPGAVFGQGVPGGGLLQQGSEDVLQLGEAGAQGGGGEEVQLVGRVEGQDGDEPPAPRRAIC